MTDRKQKLVQKLLKANPTENEEKMLTLVIERICADMADFFEKFFNAEGPGVCLLYTSPSPRDNLPSRMPSSA